MAWLSVLDRAEQVAWAAGYEDGLFGRPSRAGQLPEDVRAFYLAGWEGVAGG